MVAVLKSSQLMGVRYILDKYDICSTGGVIVTVIVTFIVTVIVTVSVTGIVTVIVTGIVTVSVTGIVTVIVTGIVDVPTYKHTRHEG